LKNSPLASSIRNVNALEAANQRLADLIEVSRLLASEHDGEQLLAKFCPAARELIGARMAFVGVFSNLRILHPVFVSGMERKASEIIGSLDISGGLLARLAAQEGPLRIADVKSDPIAVRLPSPHFEQLSFLGIRLSTPDRLYGLLWLLEKLGGDQFGEEDENMLMSLAAQAGIAYENAERYREIQQYASGLERRVEERTGELQEANNELEAFSYSVAHDLRAPLRQIHGFAEILKEDSGTQMPAHLRDSVDRIQDGVLKMVALVDGLLQLSQVVRKDLQLEPTELDRLAAEVVRGLGPETKDREIEWKIGPLPRIDCDPVLMKQVFANLLANAVKYTRPRQHAVIEVQTQRQGTTCIIMVRDNGVGFDMRYADKLFGVFQRLHSAGEFEGTGAGLAIVHRVLRRHGYRIWAEAEPNKGAAFYFTVSPHSS